MKETQPC